MRNTKIFLATIFILATLQISAQSYFFKAYEPFDSKIPSPEEFLGYPIGSQHTRHDRIVAYLKELADVSNRAQFTRYGYTHEQRELVILTITTEDNLTNIEIVTFFKLCCLV